MRIIKDADDSDRKCKGRTFVNFEHCHVAKDSLPLRPPASLVILPQVLPLLQVTEILAWVGQPGLQEAASQLQTTRGDLALLALHHHDLHHGVGQVQQDQLGQVQPGLLTQTWTWTWAGQSDSGENVGGGQTADSDRVGAEVQDCLRQRNIPGHPS